MPVIVQHQRTSMYLARNTGKQYRSLGATKLVGAAQAYKWVRTADEAERFDDDSSAERAGFFVGDPPIFLHTVSK